MAIKFQYLGSFTYPETPMGRFLAQLRYDVCIIDSITYAILSELAFQIKTGRVTLFLAKNTQKNTFPEAQMAGIQELVLLRKESSLEFPICAPGAPKIFCPFHPKDQLFPTLQWSETGLKINLVLKPKIDSEDWILLKK